MLLTISLLFLSNVALTKSAPRAKPRVSSVFSIHVCQRGVQDCNKAKTGTTMDYLTFADTVAADTSVTCMLKLALPFYLAGLRAALKMWHNATEGQQIPSHTTSRENRGNLPFWSQWDFLAVCPEHSQTVDPNWPQSSEPESKSCNYLQDWKDRQEERQVGHGWGGQFCSETDGPHIGWGGCFWPAVGLIDEVRHLLQIFSSIQDNRFCIIQIQRRERRRQVV